jgi:hypothetical protein
MIELAAAWWMWAAATSLQLCLLVPFVACVDRAIASRPAPGAQTLL